MTKAVSPVRWVPIAYLGPEDAAKAGLTPHQRAEALLMATAETILMETARLFAGEDGWSSWYKAHGGKVRYDSENRACVPVARERIAWRAVVKSSLHSGRGSTLGRAGGGAGTTWTWNAGTRCGAPRSTAR